MSEESSKFPRRWFRTTEKGISSLLNPKSQRFSQLSFDGFKPLGRYKIEKTFKGYAQFIRALFIYFFKKIRRLLALTKNTLNFVDSGGRKFKRLVVSKLIWSRGRLGRPVANLIVISAAFLVFVFGEVLNSTKLVNSQEINPDYLSNVTDIIPQKNSATTLVPESRKRAEAIAYAVQQGDTLSGIGEKFKITTDALRYVNNLTDTDYLKVGQTLTIPPISGLIHKVESGDTLQSIADKYDVPAQAVADFNYILDTSKLAVGTELIVPDAKIPQPVIVPAIPSVFSPGPSVDSSPSKGWCRWPTTVRIITQYFSWYHDGVDIATPWGYYPPLFACASGTIVRAGWDPWGLGLNVQIDHGNGYVTVYGHMSRIDVGYGERVSSGEQIGVMGNTGRSTGPHVHFTIKYNGVAQNPFNYIN